MADLFRFVPSPEVKIKCDDLLFHSRSHPRIGNFDRLLGALLFLSNFASSDPSSEALAGNRVSRTRGWIGHEIDLNRNFRKTTDRRIRGVCRSRQMCRVHRVTVDPDSDPFA